MGKEDVLGPVYETLLCSPGMKESVKIDLKMNWKTILLLNNLIESGVGNKDNAASGLMALISEEDREGLKTFGDECLKKADLKELSEKLKSLPQK